MISIICTILLCFVTVLPLSKHSHWIIRSMDFPRLQITVFGFICLLITLFFAPSINSRLILTALILICLFYQFWWIAPYTIFWKKEVKRTKNSSKHNNISILTSNVLTTNKESQKLIALVNQYQPDVLVTLETDSWWEEQLNVLEKDYPYTIKCPLDNLYGMHLYSKLTLSDIHIKYLVEEDVPSFHFQLEMPSGHKVQMHSLHPAPPSPTENEYSTERDAELILVAKSIMNSKEPIVITGDLNDVAWSSTTRLFRKISGLLDPRIGRGMYNTFHANIPFLRWPLDHIFHSKHFTVDHIERLSNIGSDHFPLYTSLSYNFKLNQENDLELEHEDLERAQEITSEADVSVSDVPNLKQEK